MVRRLGKVGVLFLALVLALGGIGAAFAAWTDTLTISGTVSTGSLCMGFLYPEKDIEIKDQGPDWTCDTGTLFNVRPVPEGKDVGNTTLISVEDTDGDGCKDTMTLLMNDVYPSYYNHIDFWLIAGGTIPQIIHSVDFTFDGETKTLYQTGYLLWPDKFELYWGDNFGVQRHPGDQTNMSFDYHFLQDLLEQNHQYTLTIHINTVQWNKYVAGPLT